MKRIALTALAVILCTLLSAQDSIPKRSYNATFTSQAPVIDGSIEDEAWQAGAWDGDFVQFEPVNGGAIKPED